MDRTTAHGPMTDLIVVMAENARAAQRAVAAVSWCFLGSEVRKRALAERQLGVAGEVDISAALDEVARAAKQPYLDWLADLGRVQRSRLRWWSSTMASRSTVQSDFFLLICYAELIRRWAGSLQTAPVGVVVVDDPWLWMLLRSQQGGLGIRVPTGRPAALWLGIFSWWSVRRFLCGPYVLARLFWTRLVARLVLPPRLRSMRVPAQGSVLIHTWIDERFFVSAEDSADPLTGPLQQLLEADGKKVARLTSLQASRRGLARLARIRSPLLVGSAAMRIHDFARAFAQPFKLDGFRQARRFRQMDIGWLLRRQCLLERSHHASLQYRLWFYAFRRIACASSPEVEALIYPFENQPWEKMLCLAWRESAPTVRLIAYQHASVPDLFLHYFLGKGESEFMPLPDIVAANGRMGLEKLRSGGIPARQLRNVGALRFQYLHRAQIAEGRQPRRPSAQRPAMVLVAFPLARAAAQFLLADLVAAFSRPLEIGIGQVRFALKVHPLLSIEKFGGGGFTPPPWFDVVEGDLRPLLARASLFLYVPPSATCWEAYFCGLPLLRYKTSLLDIDPLSDREHVPTCHRGNLRAEIQRLLQEFAAPVLPSGSALEDVFGTHQPQVWAEILPHNQVAPPSPPSPQNQTGGAQTGRRLAGAGESQPITR